jgi:glycosyltransferase involved in cell wall biosynthesis
MKLLSIAVPSYNSEAYLSRCLESLLLGGERVEIIVIDDGSKDKTGAIADSYSAKYPTIIKVIHQENGGHGEGVNQGLLHATGLYYKVVDSDDLLDPVGYKKLLDQLEAFQKNKTLPDLVIADFVYDRDEDGKKSQYVSTFSQYFKPNQMITWDNVKDMHTHHLLLMHALFYRRQALLESHTILPKHCFYVDDIFAYKPLPYCKTIYCLPYTIYLYQIGRPDQSVQEDNFVARYPMLLTVMKNVFDAYTYEEIKAMPKGLRRYMVHAIGDLNLTALFAICGGKNDTKKRKAAFQQYFQDLKKHDLKMYHKVRYFTYYGLIQWMPYWLKRKIIIYGYHVAVKVAKLG